MSEFAIPFDDRRSLVRHGAAGLIAIFGLLGGLAFWASTVEIAGAVVAGGSVVVESYPKRIQHQDGGRVTAILARNEQAVVEGETLVRLDSREIEADLKVTRSQWREALVRSARLKAEIEGAAEISVPAELESARSDAEIASLVSLEQQVFQARRTAQTGRAAQLNEQIGQLETQISGLKIQQQAIGRQLDILRDELADLEDLREKGLVESSRVTSLAKQQAQLEGEQGQLISVVAGARAAIAERQLQITQLEDDFITASLDELQAARRAAAEAGEEVRSLQAKLERTEIKAPQSGVVHESVVHTIGGIVGAGETLMQIVPQDDELMISVRLGPMDVDRVWTGQQATLRLSSLDARETPELVGQVASIAPSVTQDPQTGQQYYALRVRIPDDELAKLPNPGLVVPGMPVEAFVQTDEKTVLSYLVQPFADQLNRAMRED